jgi:hypothetical protein
LQCAQVPPTTWPSVGAARDCDHPQPVLIWIRASMLRLAFPTPTTPSSVGRDANAPRHHQETSALADQPWLRGLDGPAFSRLAERHRRELHVHCYRMLGS